MLRKTAPVLAAVLVLSALGACSSTDEPKKLDGSTVTSSTEIETGTTQAETTTTPVDQAKGNDKGNGEGKGGGQGNGRNQGGDGG